MDTGKRYVVEFLPLLEAFCLILEFLGGGERGGIILRGSVTLGLVYPRGISFVFAFWNLVIWKKPKKCEISWS